MTDTKLAKRDDQSSSVDLKVVPWNPWLGVVYVLVIYLLAQVVGLSILIYPLVKHYSGNASQNWVNNSTYGQFFYVLIAEAVTVLSVLGLIKLYKSKPIIIGLRKPKWTDLFYGLIAVPIYYIIYLVAVAIISSVDKGLNVNQQQNVGFNSVHGPLELAATFISLVILPPIAEEILVRGFLYGSLKKGLPLIWAAILTSIIFASAHLPEGMGGLLWIGAIDTFILSLVLIYLREKTNGLWASMTLHGFKNGLAYVIIYIAPIVQLKLLHF